MVKKSQKIRLGIFGIVSLAILVITLFFLSFEQFFEEQDIYYIAYEDISVSGLDVGSPVKYLGLKVGAVKKIKIDPTNINRVIVQVGLSKGTPIKKDVRADIATIGITGLKLIEFRGGSNEAELLKPGRFITAGTSFTEAISGKAEVIAEKIELVMNNILDFTSNQNQDKFINALDEATATISSVNEIISENKTNFNSTIANLDAISGEILLIGTSTRETMEKINAVIESDTVTQTISSISRISKKLEESDIYDLIDNLNSSAVKIDNILNLTEELVARNRISLIESIDEFRETSLHLKNAARMIDENPAILLTGTAPVNPPDDILED